VGSRRPDLPSLVAGLGIIVFGLVLLGDALDVVDLRFAVLGPVVCALLGAILLASGLARRS
jgi:hypothetical protein